MRRCVLAGVRLKLGQNTTLPPSFTTNYVTRGFATLPSRYDARDPAPVFFDPSVQEILKRVTGMNYDKVFRRRFDEQRLEPPKYEFLTDEELQKKLHEMKSKAEELLQMPPVVKQRVPIDTVLSRDSTLSLHDDCRYVFTDITYGLTDRQRLIVVRDADGTLRHASWEERDRMNQIYNPRPGRKLIIPRVFQEENLKRVLEREEYLFLLDLACAQFEPDDPDYQRVTGSVYEEVESKRLYHTLHSTRHYGPLCFYLAWNRKVDNIIASLIQDEMIAEGADIVRLYDAIHTGSASKKTADTNDDDDDSDTTLLTTTQQQQQQPQPLDVIKNYMDTHSVQKSKLQLAIQSYLEIISQRQDHQDAIKTSHGF